MGFIVQIATPQPNVIKLIAFIPLTHWGRVTHICVGNLTIIGSDNGLSPGRRQAIIWTNVGILLTGRLGTNFSEIWTEIKAFSFKKMYLKVSSAKWRLFRLGLNELNTCVCVFYAVSLMWRQDIVSPSFGPTPLSGTTLVIMAGLVIGHPSWWPLRTPETWWQDPWPSLSIVNTPRVQYMWDVQRKETLPPRVTSTTNLNEVGQPVDTVRLQIRRDLRCFFIDRHYLNWSMEFREIA